MCGIAGIGRSDDAPVDRELVVRMTRAVAHRGPDGEGFYFGSGVGFGHRRLSIVDLSTNATQPMSNEDGSVWVTFNGEIYNHLELRERLLSRGHVFRSRSDTEVLVHLYEERGADLVHELRGMFAFALWDVREHRLLLARDRLGIKPLFFHERDGEIRFGSEIKAILVDPSVPRAVDPTALDAYLAQNYVAAPRTLLRSIRQLEPGELLELDRTGRIRRRRYWDLRFVRPARRLGLREWEERLEAELRHTVRSHLMADVPYGAMLSGGIDSATMVGLLVQEHTARTLTFTADFAEESFGEGRAAKAIADELRAENYQVLFRPPTIDVLRKVVEHAEEPTADLAMPPFFAVSGLARRHVAVALSGDGADEVFAGYETYSASLVAPRYQQLPAPVRAVVRRAVEMLPVPEAKMSLREKLVRFVRGVESPGETAHVEWRRICDPDVRRVLMRDWSEDVDHRAQPLSFFDRCNSTDALERMLYFDQRYYLPSGILVKSDRMSMAHGLEVRVPYLDHVLVELAASMPPELKLRSLTNRKWILRRVARRVLPSRAAAIPRKKRGFNVPMARWLRGPLREPMLDLLSPARVGRVGLLRPRAVEALINEHLGGKKDRAYELYGLLLLSLWADHVLRPTCTSRPAHAAIDDARIP